STRRTSPIMRGTELYLRRPWPPLLSFGRSLPSFFVNGNASSPTESLAIPNYSGGYGDALDRGAADSTAGPLARRSHHHAAGRFRRILGGGPAECARRESLRRRQAAASRKRGWP